MDVTDQLHVPAALPPGKEPLVPIGQKAGWGPRAGLNTASKRKIPSPRRESNPEHPIVQPVANRLTNGAIPPVNIGQDYTGVQKSRKWVFVSFIKSATGRSEGHI
jgi:hypothetical protein